MTDQKIHPKPKAFGIVRFNALQEIEYFLQFKIKRTVLDITFHKQKFPYLIPQNPDKRSGAITITP